MFSPTIIIFICFFCFLLLNIPVAFALGSASLFTIVLTMQVPLHIIVQRFFVTFDSFTMMAIPLYMIAGQLMNTSGITERIVNFSDVLIGHVRGGLAQTNILASMLFSGISGSAAADTSVMGSMLIPAMKQKKYDTDFSVVVTCTSSCIGPIIPPSILFIIYASITGISVSKLFMAGIIPGIVVGLALMVLTYIISKKRNYPKNEKPKAREVFSAFKQAADALVMPIIIVGGVLSGFFTATESGAVAVGYAIVIGLIRKNLTIQVFFKSMLEAAKMSAVTMLIIACASIFSWILTINMFPLTVAQLLMAVSESKIIATLLLVLLFLIVGLFIDGTSAIIILVPVLAPIVNMFGFDPVHLATFMVVTLLVGGITPPVGILLYIACTIGQIRVKDTFKMLVPYFFVMVGVSLLIALFPIFSTFFVRIFYG